MQCAWLLAAFAGAAAAQQTAPAQAPAEPQAPVTTAAEAPKPSAPRREYFHIGIRLSGLGLSMFNTDPVTYATSNPALRLSRTGEWKPQLRVGGGITGQINLADNFAIAADLIYRRTGYRMVEELKVGVDNTSTTSTNEQVTTTITETTKADYWEMPVMARLYWGRRPESTFRRYFDGGVAWRRVQKIRTTRDTDISTEDEVTTDRIRAVPLNRTVMGIVAGAGVQAKDDFGIKLMPEIRYTHWLKNTFDAAPIRMNRHQVEFMMGFTF